MAGLISGARISTGMATVWLVASAALAADTSTARFHLPDGFTVEQIAGPPLVRYPLFVSFDDRGRMYVAEGTGTNLPGPELASKPLGRVLLLEDQDGDGRFDASRVFADKLVFPQGVLWHDGAVYAASHPSIWRLEDTDGDDVADRREELLTGFNFNGNGCDIHGPFLGPDGRLYWTDGRHGYKCTTRDGHQLEGLASRVWRSRADGREVERLCGGGFDNPVELVWLPGGDLIGNMDQGQGDALLHYVDGAVFPMEHPCLAEFAMTGPLLGPMKQYSAALPAGLCGLGSYRSSVFGTEYKDTIFTTYYVQHKIARYTISRDGSTYRAEDHDFLTTSDHDVRLTDVEEDADGSLVFVDMGSWFTYGFPGNPLPKPDVLGAIYRVRRSGATTLADPWGTSLDLPRRSAEELTRLLDDPRPRVRDQAISRLAKRRDEAVPSLDGVLEGANRSVEARTNAVWALCRIDTRRSRSPVRSALADADAVVRQAAIHTLGLNRDEESVPALLSLLAREELPLRLTVAEALGRIGRSDAVPALLTALSGKTDRFLEHAIVYALIRINDRNRTAEGLADANPRVRRGALVALDQMADGRLTRQEVVGLLDTDDAELQQAALDCMSRRGWAADTVAVLTDWLALTNRTAEQTRSLIGALLAFSSDETIQQLVADSFNRPTADSATRLLLLEVIGRCRLGMLPDSWHDVIGQALVAEDGAVRSGAVSVVRLRGIDRFDSRLAEVGRDATVTPDVRIAALECLAPRRQALDGESFGLLVGQLSEEAEPLLRIASARALAGGPLDAKQLVALAGRLTDASTMTLRLLLPAFGASREPAVGDALAASLARSQGADALSLAELDQALKGFPPATRARAAALRQRLRERHSGQAAYLSDLTASLAETAARPAAGRNVFFSQRVGCYGCHRVAGKGGTVGPDLSQIGRFRSRGELLESIVFPSLIVVPEFRSYSIITSRGKTVTGLVRRETAEALDLRSADLAEIRIPRGEIESVTPAAVSLMPDGLEKTMSRKELADLLEFLTAQKDN
ncbi:MAG TPA: PVC-type heme-binding CxxCH protein [Pirellulales bacterium]|nr:PVC-type heme-binding CxxCH protein [Pirellulales bacterium]